MNIPFKIYYSNCIQQYNNCLYPIEIDVTDVESLKKAVSHDYVCAKYKDNYRSIDNFISSNCVGVDLIMTIQIIQMTGLHLLLLKKCLVEFLI